MVSRLFEAEEFLLGESDSWEDLWTLNREMLIKLRPFVHEFLKEANELFSMYVYTMGNRDYAQAVLKLIDMKKVYLGDIVIARDESGFSKRLELVLADECGVVIVDNTRHVWPDDHNRNLVQITKYNYFRDNDHVESKSYAEEKRDDSRSHGSCFESSQGSSPRILQRGDCGIRFKGREAVTTGKTYSNLNQYLL